MNATPTPVCMVGTAQTISAGLIVLALKVSLEIAVK